MEVLNWFEIFVQLLIQFTPVWIAMALTFVVSYYYKDKLGLYGRLFETPAGGIGFALVTFWLFSAIFADILITFDPIDQIV